MATISFKIIGYLTVMYASAVLVFGLFVPRFSSLFSTVSDVALLLAIACPLVIAGVGLIKLRKWAAVAVSMTALYPAYWCVWAGFHPTPGNADWLGFVFGLLLLTPL